MNDDIRISASQARGDVASGRALLACAYDDPGKCAPVAGTALPMADLRARLATLPRSQPIRLLCG
jgi:hypothetical protein